MMPLPPPLQRCGCAVVGVTLATAVRLLLDPLLGDHFPLPTFFVATVWAAWYGGLGAGLLALVLGALSIIYFFTPPRRTFEVHGLAIQVGLVLYFLTGFVMTLLSLSLRTAQTRAEAAAEELRQHQRQIDRRSRVRLRLEQALRQSEERHRYISESVSDYAYAHRIEPNGEIVFEWASDSLVRSLGYTLDMLSREQWLRNIHPHDLARVREHVQRVRSGQPDVCELRLTLAGGEVRWLRNYARPIWDRTQERVVRVYGAAQDITRQKRAEEGLLQSEAEFRAFFESAAVATAQVDPATGRFVRINRTFCDLTGYTADELLQMTFLDLDHPEDRPEDFAHLQRLKTGEGPSYDREKRYVRKDGEVIWVHVSASVIRDAAGQPVRTAAVIRDVTARKEALQALKDADRHKDEFLAMLAHELRNPLASIHNALHVLRTPGSEPATGQHMLDIADRQVQQMARLLEDLLDVSRIGRAKIVLLHEVVDLAALTAQVVEGLRPVLEKRHHSLALALPDRPLRVEGDPARLEQIVTNLLTNAAKYTDPGGTIGLTVAADGPDVLLRVRDTGIGLAPDMLPRVFELFVQADEGLTRSQGGLGIGLTLVKRLVELHGGTITAHSDGHGTGSEFIVRLPAVPERRHDRLEPAPQEGPPTPVECPPRRILIVDDNVDAAQTLAELLHLYGHTVATVPDGFSALAAAQEHQPELVLLDLGMPGMDGYETARRLGQLPGRPDMVVVALTGWAGEEDRRRCCEAGFDGHLVKPVSVAALHEFLAHPRLLAPAAAP